jgi:hypothetical protein
MATTIVTKNSSTASAVPTAGQLVQGELAVNVADKRLYTEDNAGSIIVLADGVKLAGIEALADVTDTANVTAAGALMDSELTNITAVKALNQGVATTDSPSFVGLTASGEITANGGIALGDSDKATFGDSDDLAIYSTGANGYIENETGLLILKNNSDDRDIALQSDDGAGGIANYLLADGSTGALKAYHYGAEKLATTATGIDVTGDVSIGDGSASATRLLMGSGDDSKMFHNGTDTYWINDTGNIIIRNQSDDKDILIQTDDGSGGTTTYITVDGSETDVSLHYAGNTKLATTATGIDVTGNMESDSVTIGVGAVAGTEKLRVNGTVLTLSGTNSVPAIGIGDVNTGIYAPTVGTLGWTVNGTQKLLLNSTGIDVTGTVTADKVGITEGELEGNSGNLQLQSLSTGIIYDAANGFHTFRRNGTNALQINGSTGDISFYEDTGTTAKLFWDASAESLGIGTTSPTRKLSVQGGTAGFGDGTIETIIGYSTRGIIGTQSNHNLELRTNGAIKALLDTSGNVLVGTTGVPNGTSVYGAGFINIGASGLVQWASGVSTATSVSVARFYNPNGNVGSIQLSGTATSYVTSSDQRLKENIADADDAGSKIDAIQVRQYDWKADGSHQDYGMVAQELQLVAPEAVSGDADSEEMMGVDYSKLVPMLIKEIQSLRNRVAQLEGI